MDQQKLRTLVFEKTGVRIDIDDPIFALVALNEAVLAEAVERHVALIDDASADLADQLQAFQEGGAARPLPALLKSAPAVAGAPPVPEKRLIAIAGGAALGCAALVLAGQALLFKPAAPAPAREAGAEQSAALREHAKLKQIIDKLDPKTRAAIETQLRQP